MLPTTPRKTKNNAQQEFLELNNGRKMPALGIGTFTGFVADKPMTTSEAVTFALKGMYNRSA